MAGRPIECDRAEATRKATIRFWEHGYRGTSVADLVAETGLNRFGLYGEFGGKKGMFLKACEGYADQSRRCGLEPLSKATDPEKALQVFFAGVVASQLDEAKPHGCLMINTLSEGAFQDPDVQRVIREHFDTVEKIFAEVLARAVGKKANAADVRHAASLLLNNLFGIVQMARLKPGRPVLERVASDAVKIAVRTAKSS
ncbi:MAG TPA: helix-turn-helix domain-containing protein [Candidatus Limnocylindria bacterium]|nr:helix-turn-helix domain-containing protein [Candidatus Limnocylindria bacterium]